MTPLVRIAASSSSNSSNSNSGRLLCWIAILLGIATSSSSILSSSSFFLFADAYRIGDTVDASVTTRSSLGIDLLVANQPLFGVAKTSHLPRLPERFSMSFEEGLHTLPYVDAATTEKLVVTFVYTKSGAGKIHSVTGKAVGAGSGSKKQKFDKDIDIEVVFEWVEEAGVDLEAGNIAMYTAVLLVAVVFFVQLCMLDHDADESKSSRKEEEMYYKGR
mmetsp:Transcript_3388/g.7751  ORF Transcript_3388/g.7751 Transcript_3388/m.7751 type:complete len:218 (+) Transcript_3388:252-905(+)|eukprot:CAMPEP_0201137044 /NCGR_PEP_ID=MMETSP0850-20130426/55204_1 /ASSEMBLY_ACC=CAM_ASM_000622 /TAXON_ID=183588 /ORGANISM="Pseudo-nitzschia fraudulenta, Strain WWA7" /LENGTH=217 /DNA_ID=CAMNT_0047408379 /DNA_START=170 /DNA_END=823 /DNA_ORIENTATION=-